MSISEQRLKFIANRLLDDILDSCCSGSYMPSCEEKLRMLGISLEEAKELGCEEYFECK